MKDKKKNGWIKFVPSLDLPKERVSIAYDTHDERGVRYAYGYFQFYNGTCGCFWKDGNEQPKVVKAEDIKYWMPVPSLDMQEEPVSEDLDFIATRNALAYVNNINRGESPWLDSDMELAYEDGMKAGANWQKQIDNNNANHALVEQIKTQQMCYEKGMADMKQQMMAKAVDARCFGFQGAALFSFRLPADKYLVGSEVKVIIIKED